MLVERFPALPELTVLDVGGEVHSWLDAEIRPRHVTLMNPPRPAERAEDRIRSAGTGDWMTVVAGDACEPPDEIKEQRYDLVYSNSVIEHVGGHLRRRRCAHWVRALGDHHRVHANRFFPIEPHFVIAGIQFAPPRLQVAVLTHWPYTRRWFQRLSWTDRLDRVMGIELLSPTAFGSYFPDSELVRERVWGLTKSLIAVR